MYRRRPKLPHATLLRTGEHQAFNRSIFGVVRAAVTVKPLPIMMALESFLKGGIDGCHHLLEYSFSLIRCRGFRLVLSLV
jgi:hypothetical protein